jgi:hypothetical protein
MSFCLLWAGQLSLLNALSFLSIQAKFARGQKVNAFMFWLWQPRRQLLNNTNSEIFISKYGEFGGFFFSKASLETFVVCPFFVWSSAEFSPPKKSLPQRFKVCFCVWWANLGDPSRKKCYELSIPTICVTCAIDQDVNSLHN